MGVSLARAGRVAYSAHFVGGGAAQFHAREMLGDLLLQPLAELNARRFEEANLDDLGVGCATADVNAELVAFGLEQVPVYRGRQDTQVGDVDTGRVEPRDQRPLDHAAGGGRFTAGDDAGALLQRRARGSGQAHSHFRRQIDVDETDHAVLAEKACSRP